MKSQSIHCWSYIMKSILQVEQDKCFLCGKKGNLDTHHVMNGPFRKKSEKWGGVIKVCRDCHRKIHDNPSLAKELKQGFQHTFGLLYGQNLWMKEFKKNYEDTI